MAPGSATQSHTYRRFYACPLADSDTPRTQATDVASLALCSRAVLAAVSDGRQMGRATHAAVARRALTLKDRIEGNDGLVRGLSLGPEDPADRRVRDSRPHAEHALRQCFALPCASGASQQWTCLPCLGRAD
jgi:hypothetical protein